MNRRGFLKLIPLVIPTLGLSAIEDKPKKITVGDFKTHCCPSCGFALSLRARGNMSAYPVEPTAYADRWLQCSNGKCKTKNNRYHVPTTDLEIIT